MSCDCQIVLITCTMVRQMSLLLLWRTTFLSFTLLSSLSPGISLSLSQLFRLSAPSSISLSLCSISLGLMWLHQWHVCYHQLHSESLTPGLRTWLIFYDQWRQVHSAIPADTHSPGEKQDYMREIQERYELVEWYFAEYVSTLTWRSRISVLMWWYRRSWQLPHSYQKCQ